ncbi:MAG: PQQ-binding-like beta-propeller repeat protein [Mycobacteriales bacterium]
MTRRRFAGIALATVAGIGATGLPADAGSPKRACAEDMSHAGGDWATYGQDLLGAQRQTARTSLSKANLSKLKPTWSLPSTTYQSVPIVAGGCVFIVDGSAGLEAFNARTGQLIWRAKGIKTAGAWAPSVHKGLVHIGLQNGGQPVAAAFHITDGSLAWVSKPVSFGYRALQQSSAIVWTPKTYPRGIQILTTTGPDFDPYARPGYALLDATTGRTLYQAPFIPGRASAAGFAGGGVWGTPSVDARNGFAYMGTANPYNQTSEHYYTNAVLKIDVNPSRPTFGRIVDYFKGDADALVPEAYNTPACTATGGVFPNLGGYGGSPACTQADVDFGVGPTLWRAPASSVYSGTTLMAIQQKSGTLWVLNAETMSRLYSVTLGPNTALVTGYISRIATDGKTLYVVANQVFYALAADTGKVLWTSPLASVGGNVALANDVVYYVTAHGLVAYDKDSGIPLYQALIQDTSDTSSMAFVNSAASGVAVAGNRITTNTGGTLIAYGLP